MKISQYEIWLGNLNPQRGTEAGKKRPVLVIQTNILNQALHPSTIICPITTNVIKGFEILRLNVKKGTSNLEKDSDILLEQMRVIDNRRLISKLGVLPTHQIDEVKSSLKIILDLE